MTSGSSGSGRERRQPESSSQAGDGDPFPSSSHILLVSPFRPPLFLLRPSSLVPSSCPVLESLPCVGTRWRFSGGGDCGSPQAR